MRTTRMKYWLLSICLLPACYGKYVVAHEILPPRDCGLDSHRTIRVSDSTGIVLRVPLECTGLGEESIQANVTAGSRLMVLVADSGTSDLLRAPFRQRSGGEALLTTLSGGTRGQVFQGRGRETDDRGRFWTEQVALNVNPWESLSNGTDRTASELILFVAGSPIEPTAGAQESPESSLRTLLQIKGSGAYRLEPREAERVGVASSGLVGIGILAILTIWWGNR